MNKTSRFSIVALCLCALTATAGPISPGSPQSGSAEAGLHILAMPAADQLDLTLWNRSVAAAQELPALWEGAVYNGPVASVGSAPRAAASYQPAGSASNTLALLRPGPSPFSFLLLAAGLALGSYTLRRTRISALPACG